MLRSKVKFSGWKVKFVDVYMFIGALGWLELINWMFSVEERNVVLNVS